MPSIARHGDPCGGTIIATALHTRINGVVVARLGDSITPHGTGDHAAATLVQASSSVKAEGIRICRVGDAASCGHTITAGSPNANAGG